MFNILNKQTLNAFPYPWLLSTIQLGAGVVWMAVMWGTGLQAVPKVSKDFLKALAPVALFHTIGHVSTCVAISSMAVSFTHVVKVGPPPPPPTLSPPPPAPLLVPPTRPCGSQPSSPACDASTHFLTYIA